MNDQFSIKLAFVGMVIIVTVLALLVYALPAFIKYRRRRRHRRGDD